jgi:flagellar motility protein MotE (MotC chaperone)
MRAKIYIIFTVLVVLSLSAYAANKVEKKAEAAPSKREYTEEEFRAAVFEEASKMMKKAGSANLVDFSKELLEKEEDIKVKEFAIKKQEEELNMNMADFKKKLVEFQDSQKKFLGCVDEKDARSLKRVTQMVDVISGMKPQNAADILSIQDPDLSVQILSELDSAKLSKIFNLMDKEVSARLQKQFLQMKK